MKRDVAHLTDRQYDILVIGGGVHGACVAWDAALRGFSVALVEKEDFGHATSANSLKTVHGGLRYLQDVDVRLVRQMIRERTAFARIAPHLVHPLPCVMPTSTTLMRSKPVMAAALFLNDVMGFDRNSLQDPQKHLPRSRVISKDTCLDILPGIAESEKVTGGALWYDYQMYNTERMTLAFVHSAADAGADVANYVEAVDVLLDGTQVTGIRARDVLTDDEFAVRTKVVINAAGPWVNQVLGLVEDAAPDRRVHLSTAMNLVTRQVIPEYAAGIPGTRTVRHADGNVTEESRLLFVAPWREYSIIGTDHAPYSGRPDEYTLTEAEIRHFLDEFNAAYPGAGLTRDDVYLVHSGFLPAAVDGDPHRVKLVREGRIYDHHEEDGIAGIITVAGVKYTTARLMAERAVDTAARTLGQTFSPCTTNVTPLHGGHIERFDDFVAQEMSSPVYGLRAAEIERLIHEYGSQYRSVLRYLDERHDYRAPLGATTDVIAAQVLYAVREEMAQTLADVVFRRTALGSAGYPGAAALRTCAEFMAAELDWDDARAERELDDVRTIFRSKRSLLEEPDTDRHTRELAYA